MMLTVDYQEFEPETYKGFYVYGSSPETRVYSGNPMQDYKKILSILDAKKLTVILSSQIDNYLMDSKDDKLAKLVYRNEKDREL